jgi:hypothetical protein
MEEQQNDPLQPHFEAKAAPPPERVTVSLDLDADILGWLKEQPTDWQRELNNLARFFMETSQIRESQYAPDAWEPGEMQEPTGPTPAVFD